MRSVCDFYSEPKNLHQKSMINMMRVQCLLCNGPIRIIFYPKIGQKFSVRILRAIGYFVIPGQLAIVCYCMCCMSIVPSLIVDLVLFDRKFRPPPRFTWNLSHIQTHTHCTFSSSTNNEFHIDENHIFYPVFRLTHSYTISNLIYLCDQKLSTFENKLYWYIRVRQMIQFKNW